ncbi:hypothetical protein FA95DRAFT_616093 [Auriscalpium vulgare]|uniref:Uncharacterized protein n=1 Tax=Auriscalpium vulgare TaxID=40419 RepID=A0ACB8RD76_9AGAM|nr:hypothetical protein FA95DRAFT_616093 [Auriscalpium vulgare]
MLGTSQRRPRPREQLRIRRESEEHSIAVFERWSDRRRKVGIPMSKQHGTSPRCVVACACSLHSICILTRIGVVFQPSAIPTSLTTAAITAVEYPPYARRP